MSLNKRFCIKYLWMRLNSSGLHFECYLDLLFVFRCPCVIKQTILHKIFVDAFKFVGAAFRVLFRFAVCFCLHLQGATTKMMVRRCREAKTGWFGLQAFKSTVVNGKADGNLLKMMESTETKINRRL